MKLIATIAAALMCVSMNAATHNSNLQHRYERDAQGRFTSRTAYAWNGHDWQPALRWSYAYSDTGYTIELARYDSRRHRFAEPMEKVVYTFTPDHSSAWVTTYTRNDDTAALQPTDSMLAVFPDKDVQGFIAAHP